MRNRWLVFIFFAAGALAAVGIAAASGGIWPGTPTVGAAPAAPLRFLSDSGVLADQSVRVLCYTETLIGYRLSADIPTRTDSDGHPQNLPIPCDALAALYRLDSRDTNKPGHGVAYDVYATSWAPGASTPTPADGDITLSEHHPLVLFRVVVSLEWEPSSPDYLDQMHAALREASAYLYTASAGQLAFGKVEMHTNADAWDGADIRVLAANDFIPAAYVGGIVPKVTTYRSPKGVQTLYAPAEIFLGRAWDGERAWDMDAGRWSNPDGYRTLVHEWAHYALFLYDEYRQMGGPATYCTCSDLPLVGATPAPGTPTPPTVCAGVSSAQAASLMAFQYTAGEFWHPLANGVGPGGTPIPPTACVNTDQDVVNGEADWSTLERWSRIQKLGREWLRAPSSLAPVSRSPIADALFDTEPAFRVGLPLLSVAYPPDTRAAAHRSAPHTVRSADATVRLRLPGGGPAASIGAAQVYVVPSPDSPAIVYQGMPHGPGSDPSDLGPITLLGVGEKSEVYAYADQYTSGGGATVARHYVYPAPGASSDPPTDGATLALADSPWRPTLNVTFDLKGPEVGRVNISLDAGAILSTPPMITLVAPDAGPVCGDCRQAMSGAGALWTASYSVPDGTTLPRHGVLRIDSADAGTLMRWYQASGVGPAHMPGFAPLMDSLVTVSAPPDAFQGASAVLFMPATSDRLLDQLPPGVGGTLGLPLDVKVAFQDRRPPEGGNMPLPGGTTISLAYDPDLLARLGFTPSQLRIAHLVRSGTGGQWQITERSVNPKGADFRNWVTTPIFEDGIYAIVVPPAFSVSKVSAVVRPDVSNVCPTTFTAYGEIETDGPGVVRYQWERSDGGLAPVEQITFSSAGVQTVQDTWELGVDGDYWLRLHILAPNDLVSDNAAFQLTCPRGR